MGQGDAVSHFRTVVGNGQRDVLDREVSCPEVDHAFVSVRVLGGEVVVMAALAVGVTGTVGNGSAGGVVCHSGSLGSSTLALTALSLASFRHFPGVVAVGSWPQALPPSMMV